MATKLERDPSPADDSPTDNCKLAGLDLSSLLHECPVCLHELDDPKVLHCGHNLCPRCVGKIASSGGSKAGSSITCPECRRVTRLASGIEEIPTNFALKEMISQMKSIFGPFHVSCADCLEKIPQNEAFVCTSVICTLSTTSRIDYTEGSFDDVILYAPPKLCSECAVRLHRNHGPFQKLEDSDLVSEKGMILKLDELAEERQIIALVRKIHAARNDVEELFKWWRGGDLLSKVKTDHVHSLDRIAGAVKNSKQPLTKQALAYENQNLEALIEKAKSFIANEDLLSAVVEDCRERMLRAYNDPCGTMLEITRRDAPVLPVPPANPDDDVLPGQKGRILRYLRIMTSLTSGGVPSEQIRHTVNGDDNFQADIQALLDEAYIFQTVGDDIYAAV